MNILLAVVGASAIAIGVQTWRLDSAQDETARIRAESDAAIAAADAQKRRDTDELRAAAEGNANALQARLKTAAAVAAAARGDLDRLRIAAAGIAAPDAGNPGTTACPDDGRLGVIAGLLAEGAGLVAEGGERVDKLAAAKAALQLDAAETRRVLAAEQ